MSLSDKINYLLEKYPNNVHICDIIDSGNLYPNKYIYVTVGNITKGWKFINKEFDYLYTEKDFQENRKNAEELIEYGDGLKHRIILTSDTYCAHDEYEEWYYPRKGFKKKPLLKKDTILIVDSIFQNLYGEYYRCITNDGTYDIPTGKAKYYSGIINK